MSRVLGSMGVLCLLLHGIDAGAEPVMQWHAMELAFSGPTHDVADVDPNPFLDFRLQCRLTAPSGRIYDVPGFFDADGKGGEDGSTWMCRFSPDELGDWTYTVSFRSGPDVAVSLDPSAGTAADFDGSGGRFLVIGSDKTGRDFRAPGHGRLLNLGTHYLQFTGSGIAWVKAGVDIPENFFGYAGFHNTPNAGHTFAAHVTDWMAGDPDWDDGAGRGIIGALNYLAAAGANSIYFIPMNVGGDADDTFPTISPTDKLHYDPRKLAQWDVVLTHADARGIFVHFQLCERENENYHDGGTLGRERKLYYRELIARFGHHLGLEWDLGEENNFTSAQHEQFAGWIRDVDPYDHPVTTHSKVDREETFYAPLLGNRSFAITAFQPTAPGLGATIMDWRRRSTEAGVPWVISVDEPVGIQNDVTDREKGYPFGRTSFLWPVLASGGGGFEWYVQEDGGGNTYDQRIDDFREMAAALAWTRNATNFFSRLHLLQSEPQPAASDADFTLAEPDRAFALYVTGTREVSVDLSAAAQDKTFLVRWFNPRHGAWHQGPSVMGGASRSIGAPPFVGDAAALVIDATSLGGSGVCLSDANCDDQNACTRDKCTLGGVCRNRAMTRGRTCADRNPCTRQLCSTAGCSLAIAREGTGCGDTDVCNGIETCLDGACVRTSPPSCDDHDACTIDTCDGAAGCVHIDACAARKRR